MWHGGETLTSSLPPRFKVSSSNPLCSPAPPWADVDQHALRSSVRRESVVLLFCVNERDRRRRRWLWSREMAPALDSPQLRPPRLDFERSSFPPCIQSGVVPPRSIRSPRGAVTGQGRERRHSVFAGEGSSEIGGELSMAPFQLPRETVAPDPLWLPCRDQRKFPPRGSNDVHASG